MQATKTVRLAALGVAGLVLAACEDPAPPPAEKVRAIKPYYVVEPAGGAVRRYSGTLTAAESSALSFAVSGTLQEIRVNKGDRVQKGQILVVLDLQPFELNVAAAKAEMTSANASLQDKRGDLERQRDLFQRGWVAKAKLDQSQSAYEAARGQINLARSRLGLAERDLANARLVAPFDGVVARRDAEPFTEISQGSVVLQIDSDGTVEVDLSVPDKIVGRLSIGAPVEIEVRTVAGCGCTDRISEIGSEAGAANTVPVTAAILQGPTGLLPGMAADVRVALADTTDQPQGFLVPLVAIAPGDDSARGYVFKFDEATGTVKKTPIVGQGTISGNMVAVRTGIAAGDVIAGAGVSLLRDGQKVRLLGQ